MNAITILPFAAAAGCAAAFAASLVRRRPGSAGWSLAAGLLLLALERTCAGLALTAPTFGAAELWSVRRLLLLALLPAPWLLFSALYARGGGSAGALRWSAAAAALAAIPLLAAAALPRDLAAIVPASHAQRSWDAALGLAGILIEASVLVGAVLVLLNLERTFRASTGVIRWRIKFMLLGTGLIWAVRLYTSSEAILAHQVALDADIVDSATALLALAAGIPAAMRLGDRESGVYPSRAVLQGSLTLLLCGAYLILAGGLAKWAPLIGGSAPAALRPLAILLAGVVLAALLQSDRVRLWLRQFTSRHFQRPLYDYRQIWRAFTDATAPQLEPGGLCRAVVRLTADTFSALSVTVWLADEASGDFVFAGSTALSDSSVREQRPSESEARAVAQHFRHRHDAVEFESSGAPWACALRRWAPRNFSNTGSRVCAPLCARGTLLGIIVAGDRVRGLPFGPQDCDMLQCIADHAAASLLNLQLSRQLLAARELEALQTMAAFFVHDLKNAASTLTLTLQNLPVHYDDPEFRTDALRGIEKTVAHINRIVGQLGQLRHDLRLNREERDLSQLVASVLQELQPASRARVTAQFSPARTLLDEEQFRKVVANLVLNAADAVGADGSVHVATAQNDGWVTLTVADNGCGMTEDFVRRSLFRPFQTTKRNGLGIGMFQSRMIVEAHGGRMHVASELGKGSTFEVSLPASPSLS